MRTEWCITLTRPSPSRERGSRCVVDSSLKGRAKSPRLTAGWRPGNAALPDQREARHRERGGRTVHASLDDRERCGAPAVVRRSVNWSPARWTRKSRVPCRMKIGGRPLYVLDRRGFTPARRIVVGSLPTKPRTVRVPLRPRSSARSRRRAFGRRIERRGRAQPLAAGAQARAAKQGRSATWRRAARDARRPVGPTARRAARSAPSSRHSRLPSRGVEAVLERIGIGRGRREAIVDRDDGEARRRRDRRPTSSAPSRSGRRVPPAAMDHDHERMAVAAAGTVGVEQQRPGGGVLVRDAGCLR